MEDKEIATLLKPITNAIDSLRSSLAAITLLKMVDEFYSEEERTALYAEHRELRAAGAAAHGRLMDAIPKDNLSWEQRVEKFGEVIAREQFAPDAAAREVVRATMKRVDEFRETHPLIVRLLEAKAKLGDSA